MPVTVTFVGSGDAFGAGGRFQTCIMVDAPGTRFVIDFGASSLVATSAAFDAALLCSHTDYTRLFRNSTDSREVRTCQMEISRRCGPTF